MSKLITGNYYKLSYEDNAKHSALITSLQKIHGKKKFKCLMVDRNCSDCDDLIRVSFEGQILNSGSYSSPSWVINSKFEKYFINVTFFEQEEFDV